MRHRNTTNPEAIAHTAADRYMSPLRVWELIQATVQQDVNNHVGRRDNPHGVTVDQIGAVPVTRRVNGKELRTDIVLTAADVGAATPGEVSNIVKQYGVSVRQIPLWGAGSVQTVVPVNANYVVLSGFIATSLMQVQSTLTVNLNIAELGTVRRVKYGSRGGGSGHQYNSTFHIPMDELFPIQVWAGQTLNITLSVDSWSIAETRLFLTYSTV